MVEFSQAVYAYSIIALALVMLIGFIVKIDADRYRVQRYEELEKNLKELSSDFIIVSADCVAGKEISEVLGNITVISENIQTNLDIELHGKPTLFKFYSEAAAVKADAVVNFKINMSDHTFRSQRFQKISISGTAVKIRARG